jgi:hypothetical protein
MKIILFTVVTISGFLLSSYNIPIGPDGKNNNGYLAKTNAKATELLKL